LKKIPLFWLGSLLFMIPALFGCPGEDQASHEKNQMDDDVQPADDDAAAADDDTVMPYQFPDDFLWGIATSAYQTEGNNIWSDFDVWNREGHGKDICGAADNSYELYERDADLAASLGVKVYRMGIEWGRIEPERDQINQSEIAHYRQVLQAIVSRGMQPMVTLHHFTNPIWIEEQGGWLNPDTVDQFVDYAALMAANLGDLADLWLTINEPIIYTSGTYMTNMYPGGMLSSFPKTMVASVKMIYAHARAYHAIQAADEWDIDGDGRNTLISIAQALYPTWPLDPDNEQDRLSAIMYDYFYDRFFFNATVNGMLDVNLDGDTSDMDTMPPEGYHEELAGTMDFIGVNYYNPIRVIHLPTLFGTINGAPCFPQVEFLCWPFGRDPYVQGDNGNEVYPPGLLWLIVSFQTQYGLPIFITENGIAATDGYLRSWFILEHLKQVHAALDYGYDVMGYLYWSLLDNFEWLEGYGMRFGLFTVDYRTFERSPTEGGATYADVIELNGITQELLDKYQISPKPR